MIEFESHYRKGFTKEHLWKQFVEGVHRGKQYMIADALERQAVITQPEVEIAQDPAIFCTRCEDLDLYKPVDSGWVGTEDHIQSTLLVKDFSEMTDYKLEEVPEKIRGYDIPIGLRNLSWFLRDYEVENYTQTYGLGNQYHDAQNCKDMGAEEFDGKVKITTLKHLSALVRKDSPYKIMGKAMIEIIEAGAKIKPFKNLEHIPHTKPFAAGGIPSLLSCMYESANRLMPISFRRKWGGFTPRPHQAFRDLTGEYMPMLYTRGTPPHCSEDQMHGAIYETFGDVSREMIDMDGVIMPNGNSAEYELSVLVSNCSEGRVAARVHYLKDGVYFRTISPIIAKRVCSKYF